MLMQLVSNALTLNTDLRIITFNIWKIHIKLLENSAVNSETLVYEAKTFFKKSKIFLKSSVPSKIWAIIKLAKTALKSANFPSAFV